MDLDASTLYRAIESRDRRFEGRFVIGVVTTGVYCRPGCPARLPRRENVRFYSSTAAAEDAGFRACRRCRPEASPLSPASLGTGATVARALRLIADGGLDGAHLADLGARLGVGERHLRRLFAEHLGTSPISVARSRRLHFARKLLDETSLPVTEVAIAAGFSSLRRFNAEVRQAFGAPPTTLRRARKTAPARGAIALRLAYKPPYDWEAILAFLRARATPGVEEVTADAYRRTVSLDGARGTIEVRKVAGSHHLELRAAPALAPALFRATARASRLFDLGADPEPIGEHLRRDRRLARLVDARPGLRVPGAWDGFELAVRAVLGQQVSVQGATTLAGRLAAAYGERIDEASPGPAILFPTPAALAGADLASIGLPRARAEAIRGLAIAVRDGELDLDAPGDPDAALARLGAIGGIGPWTAAYVAMRALGEPDALPSSDLALRRALAQRGELPDARDLERRAEAWRPWRSYAAMHLWTSEA